MTENMFKLCILVLGLIAQDCRSQDDEGPYRGKFIGKINSYHHQVSGDVYAIDEWTVLLVDFNYDGTGDDTFFWAGDSGRPGPQGFIVPDQNGKTNVLERYYNEEVRLTLPEGKRLSRVKWFAIYDIGSQNTFGDVFVPDEFEPPAPVTAGPLAGSGASSKPVQILDAATILIPELRYDGSGEEVYFWTGVGPQPSARGHKIPDEYGYLESIRSYSGEDVRLSLPGELTVFQLHWIAIYDLGSKQVLAWTPLPEAPNVPAPARSLHPHKSSLPQCRQLHRQYQAAWEVFGNQITIQLAGMIADDEYLAFGISGADDRSQMVGADVAVAYYDAKLQRGLATDYNITDKSPCVSVLGVWRGVCRDAAVGGLDDNQVFTAAREGGLTTVTYRRTLKPVQDMDREWPTDRPAYIVWAVGRRGGGDEPAHHLMYNRRDVMLNLTANPPDNDCVPFTVESPPSIPPWETAQLFSPAVRTFRLTVGPAGGRRGMLSRGGAPPPLAWYVAGQLAPDLMMRRGLTYTFTVSGGNDPHSATEYHPLVISSQRRWAAAGRLEPNVLTGVLAGVTTSRRGRPAAAAAGPPCRGSRPPARDPRRDDDFTTFRGFNRSLVWTCSSEAGAELRVTPDTSWPDTVYYHSFTHADMGGRILIVDRHRRAAGRSNAAAIYGPVLVLTIAAAVGAVAAAVTGTR